jgi:hypothetical protein
MPLTSGLPVSRLVSIDVSLTTPAIIAESVNTCMLLGTSKVIDAAERMRAYADITEVAAEFGVASEEYAAADLWFAQAPSPHILYIGRWVNDESPAQLMGAPIAPVNQMMSNWDAITDGEFALDINGTETTATGLNFTSMTNLNAVAAAITAALSGLATMVWNQAEDRFELTTTATGVGATVTFLREVTAGTGTDISGMLHMTSDNSGAYAADGQEPESALAAVVDIDAKYSSQWYAFVVPSADNDDHQMLAAFAEAADPPHYYGITTSDTGSMVEESDTDIGAILSNFGYNKTAVQYSTTSPYAIMSYLARILTTQWGGQNTTITLMYKSQPGVQPENLSTNQANVLMHKHINVYTTYANGARIIQYGTSTSGEFSDTIIGADAFALDLQNDLFNLMYTTPTKIPQTDPGLHLLVNAAVARCAGYAGNGWMGTGIWNAQGFGTLNYGDLLSLGYYVYAPSMLLQSQADRAARRAPLIMIAAKLAGAIHSVSVVVYVNQ